MTARLWRHYAIEGHTEPLGKDPYRLTHLRNGDFEDQGRYSDLRPAEEDSIQFAFHPQLTTQGATGQARRHCPDDATIRQLAQRVFQEITNLEPGRLYSFRMFSADSKDLSKQTQHALRIDFENAELVPAKSFTHVGAGKDRRPT